MTSSQENILAVVTVDRDKVLDSGAPVFVVKDREEQEKICLLLSRTLKAMAHDLENGVYVLIRH